VIYDLTNKVYRARELKKDGVDLNELRFSSETEKNGYALFESGSVGNVQSNERDGSMVLKGWVDRKQTELVVDKDERIVNGKCTCNYYYKNKLMKGPCEHMIALRLWPGKQNK